MIRPSTQRLQSRRGNNKNKQPTKGKRRWLLVKIVLVLTTLALLGFVWMAVLQQNDAASSLNNHQQDAMLRQKQSFLNAQKSNQTQQPEDAVNRNVAQEQEQSPPAAKIAQLMLTQGFPNTVQIHKLTTSDDHHKLDQCTHTIVTGYFRLRSKYAAEEYLKWMQNMLSIQDCMVIFCSGDVVEPIRKLRQHAPTKTVIVQLELDDLPLSQMGAEFWQHQLDIDPEKRLHKSYQLFWIWLCKSWLVMQAIERDYFQTGSSIFMWQDIGAFRHRRYNGKLLLQHPEVVPPGSLLWLAHHPTNPPPQPIWNDKYHHKEFYFHSGSQGVGAAPVWRDFHAQFARTLQQFVTAGLFIGEDQCVLQSTCQQRPELCAYVPPGQLRDNHYFGLRYALHYGGKYRLWRFPSGSSSAATTGVNQSLVA